MRRLVLIISILLLPALSHSAEGLVTAAAEKEVTLMGYTREHKAMNVFSEVPGKILRVNYDVGDAVGAAPFVELDTTFVDLDIATTEKSIGRLDVALKQAESRVAYLDKEFWRIDTLYKGDRATEVRRDAAAQDLEQARLERDSMELQLRELKTRLEELRERKLRHLIEVPRGWVVTGRAVESGEVIQVGVPLGRASDFRKLVVPLSVGFDELEAIRALPRRFGAELEGEPVKAMVNWINPEFDEKTRKRAIEILITEYGGPGAGGLRFTLPLRVRTEGILVPKAAIIERYENPRVRVKSTGEVVKVIVTGESGRFAIVAHDDRIAPGTELLPAE